MKLRLKPAPNPKFLWLCVVDGNLGDEAKTSQYGADRKLMILEREMFDGPMSVTNHPVIVTALRFHLRLATPSEDNWLTVANALEQIEDPAAVAQGLGYNLESWLTP